MGEASSSFVEVIKDIFVYRALHLGYYTFISPQRNLMAKNLNLELELELELEPSIMWYAIIIIQSWHDKYGFTQVKTSIYLISMNFFLLLHK